MRTPKTLVLASAAAVLVAGCGGGGASDDVRDTVKGFAAAVASQDYAKVCSRYLADEIRARLDDQGGCADRIKVALKALPAFKLEVLSVKVTGGNARVNVKTVNGDQSATASVALAKERGIWHLTGLP